MAILVANNATSYLAGTLTAVATSLTVSSGSGTLFPTISGSDVFYVTLTNTSNQNEIVKVTAKATDTFTIVRAQDGTSALAFAIGDKVELRVIKVVFDDKASLTNDQTFSGVNTFTTPIATTSGGTGLSSLGTGVATFLGTPSSANLASAVTDETGSGALVFGTSPVFTTQITTPLVIGGTAVSSALTLQSTSGVGSSDSIALKVGNNGATTALSVATTGIVSFPTTGALVVPSSTTANRPTPVTGQFRFNTTLTQFEGYNGSAWGAVGGGATGGTGNYAFYENDITISADYTITASKNAGTFGPITVNSGVTVTVPSGSTWSIV